MTDTPENTHAPAPELPTSEGLAYYDQVIADQERQAQQEQTALAARFELIRTLKLARTALVKTLTPTEAQGSG